MSADPHNYLLRTRTLLAAVAILAGCLALPAGAVYRCTDDNGRMAFQDRPCTGNGEQLNVRPATGPADITSEPIGDTSSARTNERLDEMKHARQLREVGYEIRNAQQRLASLERGMASEMEQIRRQKASAMNNLAGATWEASLSQEMDAVARRYVGLMDNERGEIVRLEAVRSRMLER